MKNFLKTFRVHGGRLFAELFGGVVINGPRWNPLGILVYGPNIAIDASLSDDFQVSITDGVAFNINAPTNPPPAGQGQSLRIKFKNTSGGAHGAGTFNAIFKTAAAGFAAIATGFSRTYEFEWDGTNWVEAFRSAADVAN